MAEVLSEREQEILASVTRAMGAHFVTVQPTEVHTIDGGEASTLRFTVDDIASSDLDRKTIANGQEPANSLADQISRDLLQQLGVVVR